MVVWCFKCYWGMLVSFCVCLIIWMFVLCVIGVVMCWFSLVSSVRRLMGLMFFLFLMVILVLIFI